MSEQIKIAFGSDDGTTLSSRFGQARKVVVVTVEDGQEIARELRDKAYNAGHHHHHDHHDHHGDDDHHHAPPTDKFATVTDCQVLVTRSIGPHGAQHAVDLGMRLYAVREQAVDAALASYLAGTLEHDPRRVA